MNKSEQLDLSIFIEKEETNDIIEDHEIIPFYYVIDIYDSLSKREYPARRYSGESTFTKDQVKKFVHDMFYDMVDSGDWIKIIFIKEEEDEY